MRLLLFALLLLSANIARADPHRIFIAGDSTAAEYGAERAPQAGWGQMLQEWFDPAQWQVRNHAKGGRSTRSFIAEGRLDAIAKDIQAGDVLLIQFGHNDAKHEDPTRYTDPQGDYQQFLRSYIAAARDKGATPILITPAARLLYDFGALLDTHGRYTLAMQQLAAQEHVGLIDLNARLQRLDPCPRRTGGQAVLPVRSRTRQGRRHPLQPRRRHRRGMPGRAWLGAVATCSHATAAT